MKDLFYVWLTLFLASMWIEQPTLHADLARAISIYAQKVQP